MAVAEASFAAAYGYDVRAEVFGSKGMVTIGDGALTSMRLHDAAGRSATTAHSDVELLADSYAGEFSEFACAVRDGRRPSVGGEDAFAALAIAIACIESVRPAPWADSRSEGLAHELHAGRLRGDGLHRPAVPRARRAHPRRRLRRRDLGLVGQGCRGPGGHRRHLHVDDRLPVRRPDDRTGRDALLATAEASIPFATAISCPHSTCTAPAWARADFPSDRSRSSPARCGWPPSAR